MHSLIKLVFVLLVLVAPNFAQAQSASPVPERRLVYTRDMDFYGADLANIFDTTQERCEAACLLNPQCQAFTFNSRSNACFPKAGVTDTTPYEGAMSARVLAADAAVIAAAGARANELAFLSADDLARARAQAEGMGRSHVTGAWTLEDYEAAITKARAEGRATDARWFAGAMALLSDRADHWVEYARLSLELGKTDSNRRQAYRRSALDAAVNGYLRSGSEAARATAAELLAQTLEINGRGRDMIPALRLAQAQQPREDVAQALDAAIAKYGFRVVEHRVDSDSAAPRLCAEFSEPLVDAGVDYDSFVQSDSTGLTAQAEGGQLCVDGVTHGQRYRITLRAGLPAASGEMLAKPVTITAYVRDRAPQVSFPGRNYILPSGGDIAVPIASVNLEQVDLTVSRISDRNLVRAMQEDVFGARLSSWQEQQFDERMAETVWQGTGALQMVLNQQVTTRLPLGDVIGGITPGIYVLRAKLPGVADYDQTAAMQWFVASDLGLSSLQGTDGVHLFVRALGSAQPREGVEVALVSTANEILGTALTDAQGYARFAPALAAGQGAAAPALVTARDGTDMAFLPLTDPEFDLSDRGVEGRAPAGPVDVFLSTDRGAYRAGDVIHATALARDAKADAIEGLPLTAVLTRPDGVEYSRKLSDRHAAGGHVFALPVAASAPRGTWRLALFADPQAPALASQNLLVEDFLPERIDFDLVLPEAVLRAGAPAALDIEARYLFGAAGADLPIEGDITLRAASMLPDWPDYQFGRHDQPFSSQRAALDYGARTASDGTARVMFDVPSPDAGIARPMTATVTVRLAEGSNRPVERQISRAVLPDGPFIGIKPAFDGPLGEGAEARFQLIGLDASGTAQAMDMTWEVNRVETRYQWYRLNGDWNWEPITTRERIAAGDLRADGAPADLSVPVDWGRYELRVARKGGGAAASVGFDAGWYAATGGTDTPDMLQVSLDRAAYRAGDRAKLRIDAREGGKLLVAVMSNRLISMQAQEVAAGESTVDVEVTEEWGAGAYVTATLIRPLDAAASRNPSRALGLAYAPVDPGARQLLVAFDVPDAAAPRGPLPVALTVEGLRTGEQAYVTLAAVDQGILNLTAFAPPDPSGYYFGQRRLGMAMRDVYGRLIDGMNGAMGAVRSGGDAMAGMSMQSPPPTQELVTFFQGPLAVGADGRVETTLDLPAFNGSLRLMAVAWSPSGVGQADAQVLVRDPVVLNASLPRFLAPDDTARMLIELTHAQGPTGDVALALSARDGVSAGSLTTQVTLAQGQTRRLSIPISAQAVGDYDLTVTLTPPQGAPLTQTFTLPVRRNDPQVTRSNRLELAAGNSFTLSRDVFAGMRAGSGTATLAIGALGQLDAPGMLEALDRYPYGCTEQVTSRALPLLYLDELAVAMGLTARDQIAERIEQAITSVLAKQDSNGAFGLWQPQAGDFWLDAYVSDFLSRSRAQGYDVPDTAFRSAMDNLRNQVNYAPDFDEGGEGLAYALYVLAREGAAAMGDLRYYADVKAQAFATPLAAAQLGAALAAYGDPARADGMFRRAGDLLAQDGSMDAPIWRADYGTRLRDRAAVLTLTVEAGSDVLDRADLSAQIAPRAGDQMRSTQEQVWSLLATHALLDQGLAAQGITVDGAAPDGPLVRVVEDDTRLQPVTFANTSDSPVAMTLTTFGVPEVAEPAGGNGYTIERRYFTMEGTPADPAQVAVGARLVTVITVQPWAQSEARLMVNDPLPAGFEIDNPNLLRGGDIKALEWLKLNTQAQSTQARTDRFLAAVDHRSDQPFNLAYVVRAVTPGSFHHPAVSVEDMYRPIFRAHGATGMVEVTP